MDKPIYIGECGQGSSVWNDAIQNTCELDALNSARSGGYAGVGIWDYAYAGSSEVFSMVNTNGTLRPVYYTIFTWSYTAALNIQISGTNVVVSWPTNATGFTLQSTLDLNAPAWNPVLPTPAVTNGQNVVTNSVGPGQMFFRLSQYSRCNPFKMPPR